MRGGIVSIRKSHDLGFQFGDAEGDGEEHHTSQDLEGKRIR